MSKTFSFSTDGMYKLKMVSTLIGRISATSKFATSLEREIFVKREDSNGLIRTTIQDIPDDFKFLIQDLNSFISICSTYPNAIIDYNDYDANNPIKRFIKIVNPLNQNDYYNFVESDRRLTTYNAPIENYNNMITKINANSITNNFKLAAADITALMKAGRNIDGADIIKISFNQDTCIFKIFFSKIENNTYKETIFDKDITVNDSNIVFMLNYDVYVYKTAAGILISFKNDIVDIRLTNNNKVKR
jgi:hypothetical protein